MMIQKKSGLQTEASIKIILKKFYSKSSRYLFQWNMNVYNFRVFCTLIVFAESRPV